MEKSDPKYALRESVVTFAVLEADETPGFFDKVTQFFGEPTDDGESEGALIERIMSYPESTISEFLKSL